MRISAFRTAHFNAAHRLFNPDWDDSKNQEVFGACSNPHYHGHNYDLEVKITGEINPDTGMLIDLKWLKEIIKKEVEDRLDHKNLNIEVTEFQTLIPTAENICIVIWQWLREKLDVQYEIKVRLYETPRNYVEFPADN